MDFSHAGYKGGGVRIPDVRVVRTVKAITGDNTAQIQAAIDEVSNLPVDASGFRGAVLLERGTYDVDGTVRIAASGVVLRGSGSGTNGTVLRATGAPHRILPSPARARGSRTLRARRSPTRTFRRVQVR